MLSAQPRAQGNAGRDHHTTHRPLHRHGRGRGSGSTFTGRMTAGPHVHGCCLQRREGGSGYGRAARDGSHSLTRADAGEACGTRMPSALEGILTTDSISMLPSEDNKTAASAGTGVFGFGAAGRVGGWLAGWLVGSGWLAGWLVGLRGCWVSRTLGARRCRACELNCILSAHGPC